MRLVPLLAALAAPLTLAACATAPGPVEVTRFVEPSAAAQLGQGTVFIASAPGGSDSLALAPYKAAVAAELRRLGYTETDRATARTVAEVRVERYELAREGGRSPVSVGVGGSTGGYGSGLGVGLGINLGGGGGRQMGTDLGVVLRDRASSRSIWEGRAAFRVSEKSPLAPSEANAQTVAAALFREFPGRSGETIQVKVNE